MNSPDDRQECPCSEAGEYDPYCDVHGHLKYMAAHNIADEGVALVSKAVDDYLDDPMHDIAYGAGIWR